jgi:hypothetical protein
MLSEARDIARADVAIKSGGWRKKFPGPSYEIGGRTVGVIGFGYVARELAAKLMGFNVRLLVYDPYVDAKTISSYGGEKVEEIRRVFREGDFVSLHARVTDEPKQFIEKEHFELMKPTACFINSARSRMVRYDELYEILRRGCIAGAALDVHDVDASAVETGCIHLGQLCIVAGTWSINEVISSEPVVALRWACRNFVERGRWINMATLPTSAANLEWFVRQLCAREAEEAAKRGVSPFTFVDEEVKVVLGEESQVFYHPFLYGAPYGDTATAGLLGLRSWHTRGTSSRHCSRV